MPSRLSASLFLAASLLLLPAAGFAATATVVRPSSGVVMRGDFIRMSVQLLGLPQTAQCKTTLTRVPQTLSAAICAADQKNSLRIWQGSDLLLGRPITRGEALQVIMALTDTQPATAVSTFRDARSGAMQDAVSTAIAEHWMQPLRPGFFGVNDPLTSTQAIELLQRVMGEAPEQNNHQTDTSNLPNQALQDAVWQVIERDFLHANTLDKTEVSYKTIESIVQSLNDPYSVFFRKDTAENFATQIKGVLDGGIGAHVEVKDGILTVISAIEGSPAEAAGLQPADQLLTANGATLSGLTVDKAVALIRGPKGTPVTLTLKRSGADMTVTIVRDVIDIPEIKTTWQGNVAVVQIMQFGDHTDLTIRDIFTEVAKKSPTGIVIDLRNDPGGLLHAAIKVMSNVVPKGTNIVMIKDRTEQTFMKTEDDPTIAPNVKVAVLINKGSASASEIVAGAMKYWKRGTLVGTTSFGKNTVQEIVNFTGGEALKLTVANFAPPDGYDFGGKGIAPDIEVQDASKDNDLQLQRAIDAVR